MPTITFRVNLEAPLRNEHPDVNTLRTESDNLENTRSTWFPDKLRNNRALKHGDEFTVSGKDAVYLKANYTTGDYALLTIVEEGLEFSEQGESV